MIDDLVEDWVDDALGLPFADLRGAIENFTSRA